MMEGAIVWCVMCWNDDVNCTVHIFSTREKADAFALADPRETIIYDYSIDNPERMEQRAN